jgi:hypothetical protein
MRKTFQFTQINEGSREEVFPLLCPVREADWIDGWSYRMIHSDSGVAEEGCVFATPHQGKYETTWYITKHDRKNYEIEFVRVTPGEYIVRISIGLKPIGESKTESAISYEYTGLNPESNKHLENNVEQDFLASMHYWEKAVNHYLIKSQKLMKDPLP